MTGSGSGSGEGEDGEQMKLQSFGFFKTVTRGTKGRDRRKEFERDFGEEEDVGFDEAEDEEMDEKVGEKTGPNAAASGSGSSGHADQNQGQLIPRPEKHRQVQPTKLGKLPEPPMHPGFRPVAKRVKRDMILAQETMMAARPVAVEIDQIVDMDQQAEDSVQQQPHQPRSSPHSARIYALPDDNESQAANKSKRPGINPLGRDGNDDDLVPSSQVDENQSLLSLSAYSVGSGGVVTDGEGSVMGGETLEWWSGIKRRAGK